MVEVITNKTATALELITKQQSQTRAAVYQNQLALDYLLAEKGGVCGKFNSSDCCLQIDDNEEAVKDLAKDIRNIAHVQVQKWKSMLDSSWWEGLLGVLWWKKVGFFLLCAVAGLFFLPCLIPCLIQLIASIVQGMQIVSIPMDPKRASQNNAERIMVLKRVYKGEDLMEEAKLIFKRNERIKRIKREYSSSQMMRETEGEL